MALTLNHMATGSASCCCNCCHTHKHTRSLAHSLTRSLARPLSARLCASPVNATCGKIERSQLYLHLSRSPRQIHLSGRALIISAALVEPPARARPQLEGPTALSTSGARLEPAASLECLRASGRPRSWRASKSIKCDRHSLNWLSVLAQASKLSRSSRPLDPALARIRLYIRGPQTQ